MQYHKHNDVANNYHVSLKTVHNWITATKESKMALDLLEERGNVYIANTPNNERLLTQLANKGKKYRNTKAIKVVEPSDDFYKLFNKRQILDIITNLNIRHEIPCDYNYLGDGARNWDEHENQNVNEKSSAVCNTIELIDANMQRILALVQDYRHVNIIDIGPGNGLPVANLIKALVKTNQLKKYIAIDISSEMLSINKKKIEAYIRQTDVQYHAYVRDILHEQFGEIIAPDMLTKQGEESINIVLFLGGTINNLRNPSLAYNSIDGSISHKDIFITTCRLDTKTARQQFSHVNYIGHGISPLHKYILNLLGIDAHHFTCEMGFDASAKERYIKVRLDTSIAIKFRRTPHIDQVVCLEKGETIQLWRAWHKTATDIINDLETNGFELLQSSISQDRQYLLTISTQRHTNL